MPIDPFEELLGTKARLAPLGKCRADFLGGQAGDGTRFRHVT